MSPILGIFASQGRVAPNSYESIATSVVGSGGSSSITFSSIPSTFKHLQIRFIARSTAATGPRAIYLQVNSDAGNNYAVHTLSGSGSAASAGNSTSSNKIFVYDNPAANQTASTFSAQVIDVLDYQNTNKYKTTRQLGGYDANGSGYIFFASGLWQSTSAITSLNFTLESGNFAEFSSFALYGIKG